MVQRHKPDSLEAREEGRSQAPQRHANVCTIYRCLLLLGTVGFVTGASIGVWLLVKQLLKPFRPQESLAFQDHGPLPIGCRAIAEGGKGDQEVPFGKASSTRVFFRVNRSTFLLEVQVEGHTNWLLLCHENWDSLLGTKICRQLGHVRLTHHKGVNLTDVKVSSDQGYALVSPSWNGDATGKWQVRSRCPSGRIVALKCSECGIAYSRVPRATEGKEAGLGRWPWQVILYLNATPMCVGTLVSQEWIATSAHCVDRHLLLSGWVASVEAEASRKGRAGLDVEKVVSHPNYDSQSHDCDIAMLKLKVPLAFSDTVQAVCLPLPHRDLPNGSTCWISGRDYQQPEHAETQMEVPVSVIASGNCNNSCMYAGEITPRMLCASHGARNVTACKVPSGVPLVCQQEDVVRLVGIGSWGTGCKPPRRPGVYTKVVELLDWIHRVMEEKGQQLPTSNPRAAKMLLSPSEGISRANASQPP